MMRPFYRRFVAVLFACQMVDCSSIGPNGSQEDATATLALRGLIRPVPGPNGPLSNVYFGPATVAQTDFVDTSKSCEGAGGSLLPPIAAFSCPFAIGLAPARVLNDVLGVSRGRTIALTRLTQYWVQQQESNLCWAAAYETVRGYLQLTPIRHADMPKMVDCPQLQKQPEGASLYQIMHIISKINQTQDRLRISPRPCTTEMCIVQAISQQRPVMILKSSHAVLIQAIQIDPQSRSNYGGMISQYWILDPAGTGKPEPVEPAAICLADAIIAF
jgi:Papain-like cysteine protease AvrRpt2